MPADTVDEDLSPSSSDNEVLTGQDAASADSSAASSAEAVSSAAEGADRDLLSVVRDVVGQSAASDSPSGEPEAKAGDGDGSETKTDEAPEDYSDVPFNKHPRFRKLLEERNTFKVHAERSQNIEAFLNETGVSNQEAANALEVIAIAKHNPAEAWERLKPWLQDLAMRAGEVLPQDLQQRVGSGEMSREAAVELAKARAQTTSLEQQRQFEREQAESRQREAASQARIDEAESWMQGRRQADPNFEKKLPHIQREVAWRHANGDRPDTPAGVKKQLEDVYAAVNKELAALAPAAPARPQRQPVKPIMGGQVASADLKPQPKSTLDVVQQTLGMRQSA